MSIMMQAMLFEKYGPRLNMVQLAEALNYVSEQSLRNKISKGTFEIKTYLEAGRRYADCRDVADHLDEMRATAA